MVKQDGFEISYEALVISWKEKAMNMVGHTFCLGGEEDQVVVLGLIVLHDVQILRRREHEAQLETQLYKYGGSHAVLG